MSMLNDALTGVIVSVNKKTGSGLIKRDKHVSFSFKTGRDFTTFKKLPVFSSDPPSRQPLEHDAVVFNIENGYIKNWGLIDDWYDEYRHAETRHRTRLVIYYPDRPLQIVWSSKYSYPVLNVLPIETTKLDIGLVNLLLENPVAGVRAVWESKKDGKWEACDDPRLAKEKDAKKDIEEFYTSLI